MSKIDCKVLKQWVLLLKQSGFIDLETQKPDGSYLQGLKSYTRDVAQQLYSYPDIEEYYRIAGQWMHETDLEPLEQILWGLHCEGYSYRQIASRSHTPMHVVRVMIPRLRDRMLSNLEGSE